MKVVTGNNVYIQWSFWWLILTLFFLLIEYLTEEREFKSSIVNNKGRERELTESSEIKNLESTN